MVKCEPRANGIEGIDCSKYVARMNVSGVGQIWASTIYYPGMLVGQPAIPKESSPLTPGFFLTEANRSCLKWHRAERAMQEIGHRNGHLVSFQNKISCVYLGSTETMSGRTINTHAQTNEETT